MLTKVALLLLVFFAVIAWVGKWLTGNRGWPLRRAASCPRCAGNPRTCGCRRSV